MAALFWPWSPQVISNLYLLWFSKNLKFLVTFLCTEHPCNIECRIIRTPDRSESIPFQPPKYDVISQRWWSLQMFALSVTVSAVFYTFITIIWQHMSDSTYFLGTLTLMLSHEFFSWKVLLRTDNRSVLAPNVFILGGWSVIFSSFLLFLVPLSFDALPP